jgi:indole-3-glycerol phosphate synthase
MTRNILDTIKAVKEEEVAALKGETTMSKLCEAAAGQTRPRGFARAIRAGRAPDAPREPGRPPRVVAEIKRASPSAGVIRQNFDPAAHAIAYEAGGAAALSCLTDRQFFRGSINALRLAREASALPVLRKDFMIDLWQVYEARAAGADAILLIAGMIPWEMQAELRDAARETGMDVLLEIHGEAELEPALALAPDVLGINNRNLRTPDLQTDLSITEELAARVPHSFTLISESGIRAAADVARLAALGIDGILVGEHLMREPDPGRAIFEKLGLGRA